MPIIVLKSGENVIDIQDFTSHCLRSLLKQNCCFASRDEGSNSENLSFTDLKPNVEELEMLIEAYFAQINGIMQKLSDVRIF